MNTGTDEQPEPRWCPEQQIYLNGVVPSAQSAPDVSALLEENEGKLRIFGYGSLCWNPGTGVLSKEAEGVTRTLGRAIGWRRCWAQRSADHRGTPTFPGIVCTLLSDDEVRQLNEQKRTTSRSVKQKAAAATAVSDMQLSQTGPPSMTEGLIYTIPSSLVEECLAELVCGNDLRSQID